jgi:N-acetylmuramoyl-L-alanine amidase
MRIPRVLAFLIFTWFGSFAQQKPDSLFLRVILPEQDTVQVPFPRHRIAASTLPSAKAFINGQETKVYASGAFVGLLPLSYGPNPVRITVRNSAGDSLFKQYVIFRTEPLKTSSHDTLTIDTVMMEPSEDRWLGKDDFVEVKFKGSPRYRATFDIEDVESGIPMRELSAREAGGLGGIYVGRYRVKDGDVSRGHPIRFKLKKSFWSSENAYSKGKVWIIPDSLPRVAEITGKHPFLNASVGTDRLGGAKLGFLQPGVMVEINGKEGDQYRVRLSASMQGWLPQEFAQILPFDTPLPRSLTGSITVKGEDSLDIVTVPLTRRLPYVSDQEVDPNAIVVDIFGATSNTNWITQQLSAKGIESVKWNQVASDQFRITIALKERQQWGYNIGYDYGSTLRIKIRRPPTIGPKDSVLAGMTIAVDAGHGGDNNGALGATGALEKDITLSIAQHLQDTLVHHGARVVLTRSGDFEVGSADRIEKALSSGARILVSIHCNSVGESADPLLIQGTSTYYRYSGFRPLASILYDMMLELGLNQFGMTGGFNFALNAPTQFPNVLVETAFLSNPDDEMLLIDDGFRCRIAQQITKGLEDFVRTYGVNRQ